MKFSFIKKMMLTTVGLTLAFSVNTFAELPTSCQAKIENILENNPGQLSIKEYSLIAGVLLQKKPCNMLVFGVGNDSALWIDLNQGGLTIFLEDNQYWLTEIREKIPEINAFLVSYETKLKEWKSFLSNENRHLLSMDLPQIILDTKWDIIFVDAPAGYSNKTPGRMKSIYMAAQLSCQHKGVTDIFVHDCHRDVEATYCDVFLKDFEFQLAIDKLRYYKSF